jgi:hypothetical protein
MANTSNKKQYIVPMGDKNRKVLFVWTGELPTGEITDTESYWKAWKKFVKRPQQEGRFSFTKGKGRNKKTIAIPGGGLGYRYEMNERGVSCAAIYEWDGTNKPKKGDSVDEPPCPQSKEFLAVLASIKEWKAGKDAERAAKSAPAAPSEPKELTVTVAASKTSPAPSAQAPASPIADPGFAAFLGSLYETWKAKQAAKA